MKKLEKKQAGKNTILTVAKLSGLSPATVSRVMYHYPYIKESIMKRVLNTIEKRGYYRNNIASGLRSNKTKTIGLIVPRISMFCPEAVITLLLNILYKQGYNAIICQSNDSFQLEKDLVKTLHSTKVDAVIAACTYKILASNTPANRMPKTSYTKDNQIKTGDVSWWCSGFYPASLLYIYEDAKHSFALNEVERRLEILQKEANDTLTRGLGFMVFTSFGNAYCLTKNALYKALIDRSATSVATRFRPKIQSVQSGDSSGKFRCPVIIDNMMKLELLCWDAQNGGDKCIQKIAELPAISFFSSKDITQPAVFYLLSSPAHRNCETTLYHKALGGTNGIVETANKRTMYRSIHEKGIQSCQLVMGLTVLETCSVWNTMPARTHTRRVEAYFYFGVPENQRIFHLMGEPAEKRHLVVNNNESIISPPWSVHTGCGMSNYRFLRGMAGENYTYEDMDTVNINTLK